MELWKPISNAAVKKGYEVSDWGRVRRRGRNLIPTLSSGYLTVKLQDSKGAKFHSLGVHRLVAKAFLDAPPHLVVKHRDGNTYNNRLTNLVTMTRSERIRQYKWEPYSRPINRYDMDGNLLASYRSIQGAAKALGLVPSSISMSLQRNKPHNGYQFRYAEKISEPKGAVHPRFPGYIVTRQGRVYSQKTGIWRKPTRRNGFDAYLLTVNGKRTTISVNRLLRDLYGETPIGVV